MENSLARDVKNAQSTLEELVTTIENLELEVGRMNQNNLELTSKIDTLEERIAELVEENDNLKIEILEAKAVITKQESEFINKMYDSNSDNDMAKTIINNMYEQNTT